MSGNWMNMYLIRAQVWCNFVLSIEGATKRVSKLAGLLADKVDFCGILLCGNTGVENMKHKRANYCTDKC